MDLDLDLHDTEEIKEIIEGLETQIENMSKDPYIHCKTLFDQHLVNSFNEHKDKYSIQEFEYLLQNGKEILKGKNL